MAIDTEDAKESKRTVSFFEGLKNLVERCCKLNVCVPQIMLKP